MCIPVCVVSFTPARSTRSRASVLVIGPSSSRARLMTFSALSASSGGMPS